MSTDTTTGRPSARVLAHWIELDRRGDELADVLTAEVGTPRSAARAVQVGIAIAIMRAYVGAGRQLALEERVGSALVLREPVGVVGAITAWNLPG